MRAKTPGSEPPSPTHDDLIKKLLHQPRLLRDFFRAFLPKLAKFADLDHIEYLDKEHPRGGKRPRRVGDVIFKTLWKKRETAFLIHVESQNKPHPAALERMGEYSLRDGIRYRLPVLLLTYPKPETPQPGELRWDFGSLAAIHVKCPVLHFRRMNPLPHLRSKNVAALALTALMKLEADQQVDAIVNTMAEALRQEFEAEDLDAALDFVNHYLPLAEEQVLQLDRKVDSLAKNEPKLKPMPKLINPFVEIGRLRGRNEGRVEGRVEGRGELALRQIARKFPMIARRAGPLVRRLDAEQLLAFGEELLFMQNPAECMDWLKREVR